MVAYGNRTVGSKDQEPNVEMKVRRFVRRPDLVNIKIEGGAHNSESFYTCLFLCLPKCGSGEVCISIDMTAWL